MMHRPSAFASVLTLLGLTCLCPSPTHAHFKLLAPASWLNESDLGAPQKGSPCGPGNTRPFIGDDVQPIPASDDVTTFHAGETIKVHLQETVYHPGYFRISFAPVAAAAATSADFPDPALTDTENCHYDNAAVKTTPHDNVLGDGLFMVDEQNAPGRDLETEVTLPSEPCEHCTLQIVQVMEGHPASSCFYFHCADIEIVAAESTPSAAGAGGAGGNNPARAAADAGASAAGANDHHDDGGCSVAHGAQQPGLTAAWYVLAVAVLWMRRRVNRRAA